MAEKSSKWDSFFKKIFNTQREGKGVEKKPRAPLTFVNFFKYYAENISMLFKINFLYVFGNFPVFFALYAMTGNLNKSVSGASSQFFGPLFGSMSMSAGAYSPADMAMFGVHGVQATLSIMTPATMVFFILAGLTILTMGPVNVGCTYLIRSAVRGNPIFFFRDFWYAIKKNFWQAEVLGIIDCVAYGLMSYNIMISYYNGSTFPFGIVFWGNIMLMIVYSVMRFYTYVMLVTFDLKTFKILKNALIFSVVNVKRNLMAVSGIAASILIVYSLSLVFLPLGVLLPFMLLFSTCAFMGCYAAYPKIKQVMIDPYYDTDEVVSTEPEPLFKNDKLE